MSNKKKTNNFLFHDRNSELVKIHERRLICRDCGYWRPEDKEHTHGHCSRNDQKTTLITRCYQTMDQMYGHDFYY